MSQDRANTVVIFTGTGGHFIAGIDFASFGNVADPAVWSQVYDEGVQILENLLSIRVPVIAAVEGRLDVHWEYALLANVIVAGEGATFKDIPHFRWRYRARRWSLYRVELPRWSRSSGILSPQPAAAQRADSTRMGRGQRNRTRR
jgi:hypothetical protein